MENNSTVYKRLQSLVIGVPIDSVDWDDALSRILHWTRSRDSRVVCICNVHSVISARQDREFYRVISDADLATPDGQPVAWMLQRLTGQRQPRINGPDLMWKYCASAKGVAESIYLYGGTPCVLEALRERLAESFPRLRIAGYYSPPFRTLTPEEDEAVVREINQSGAGVVWVSLGCPKQERWMAAHRGRIQAVMIGVGAAFDYHAGTLQRAPLWMQRNGLEWFFRLLSEPRRLWRRYLVTNLLFALYAIEQIFFGNKSALQKRRTKGPE